VGTVGMQAMKIIRELGAQTGLLILAIMAAVFLAELVS
jgi:hypothetical protein